jgi:transglutaminase-like putative cysteine protease
MLLFLLTLHAGAPGPAATEVTGSAPAGAPGNIETGEDVVILEDTLTIEIASSTEARVRRIWRAKILTEAGIETIEKSGHGALFYRSCCPIRDLRAAIIAPSGKRTDVKKQQIYDGAAVADFELYADSRYRAVTFTGAVPGSILEFSSDQEFTNLFYLPSEVAFQEQVPVRARALILKAPASFAVRTAVRGSPLFSSHEEKGVVIREWRMRDLPALKRERSMPPESDLVPRVQLFPKEVVWETLRIDATSWNSIAQWEWALTRDKVVPDPDVAARARELTAGLTDPMEMTRRIYEFVQKNINYVAIEIGIGGYEPHQNGTVFRNRYGDCKDKATLTIAMLGAVGLRGYPVTILTRDEGVKDADFPSPRGNHEILAVPLEEGYLFMDPTSNTTAFGDLPWVDQGANVLVVKEDGTGEMVTTPIFPPERNRIRWSVIAAVNSAGAIEGTLLIDRYGQSRAELDAYVGGKKPSEIEHALERYIATVSPGASMLAHEITPPAKPDDPLHITIRFSSPHAITRAGSVEVLSPHLVRFQDFARIVAYPVRLHPVFFDYLWNEESEIRLALPPGRTLKKVPGGGAVEGGGVTVSTSYETTTENGRTVLVVKRIVSVNKREVPVAEYPALRKALSSVSEEESRAVTLLPAAPPPAT